MIVYENFLEKAKALEPKIFERTVRPIGEAKLYEDKTRRFGWNARIIGNMEDFSARKFKQDDVAVLDFGEHMVGYLRLKVKANDSHADSPLRLKLTFGELPCDTAIPAEAFDGILGRSWLQTEIITMDAIPGEIELPRRYAFRYLRIEVTGLSPYYTVSFVDVSCRAITSADETKLLPLTGVADEELRAIDAAGIRTFRDCMMRTFEDGPKRDRRQWAFESTQGFFANAYTYRAFDMVRRSLYLQAAFSHDDGNCAICFYVSPEYEAGNERMAEQSASFIWTLAQYVKDTGDVGILAELWPTAKRQMHATMAYKQADDMMEKEPFFLYWSTSDNELFAQAFTIRTLQIYKELAEQMGEPEEVRFAKTEEATLSALVKARLYDEERGVFVSGTNREVSLESQVWAATAGLVDKTEVAALYDRTTAIAEAKPIESTATYAFYVMSLLECDEKERAVNAIKVYWGEMLREGGDTLFEHFNLSNTYPCPYRQILVDSYCHGCQSIVSYLIRKYLAE